MGISHGQRRGMDAVGPQDRLELRTLMSQDVVTLSFISLSRMSQYLTHSRPLSKCV